ncbi:MAG: DegV family protein [Anaerolineae bacterium]
MGHTVLVTDSTAVIPQHFINDASVRVVPLYIQMGERSLRDCLDITPAEFYERLPGCSVLPTTSQPSVGDFAGLYKELAGQGATQIISVHLSAGISGTVNSARLAAEQIEGVAIEIVDVRCASAAHRLTVEAARRALRDGASFSDALAAARRVVESQRTLFLVETLEYLYKGGRIGGAAALFGSLLQFKPLLYFKDGKIEGLERVRKSSRALERMAEVMTTWVGSDEPMRIMLMEAASVDKAEELLRMLRDRINVAEAQIVPLSPVIGAHVGTGTLGLCCCPISICGPYQE